MDEPKLSRMGLVAWELGAAITAPVFSLVVTTFVVSFVRWLGWLQVGQSGILLALQNLVGAPMIGYALARRYRRRLRWGPCLFGLALALVCWVCATSWWPFVAWVWEKTLTREMINPEAFYMYGTVLHLALVGLLWSTCVLLAELRPRR